MSRFLTDLVLKDNGDGRTFTVVSALVYQSDILRSALVVPAGTVTDLASIPLLPNHRTWSRAAVVHDWLYTVGQVPRLIADDVLREAMIALQVPAWRRGVVYLAVRVGGQAAWQAHRTVT